MATFAIINDGFLKGNRNSGKRTAIRNILFNLLQKARLDPDQFEANVFHDGRPDTTVPSGGCKYRNMDGKDLTVSVVVGNEYFVVKLRSRICNPQKLNQAIREALGTPVKDQFLFVDQPVFEKEKPKALDQPPTQPQPTPQPQPQAPKPQLQLQPQPPTPQVPIMQTIKPAPDLEQSFLSNANLLAAHLAIWNEVGDQKSHPFDRAEAQDWMNTHGLKIPHHVVTGRILGSLVRRGLYTKDEKAWIMTSLGVEVAQGKPLPEDETPKKPRKKRGSPDSPESGEIQGGDEDDGEPKAGELDDLLKIAGNQADSVRDLVETCNRLRAIEAEKSVLLPNKEKLIARLEGNSAGILVVFLRQSGIID